MSINKKLILGESDFKIIIDNKNYFVDKSLLIEEVITEQNKILLFPRPRRFGKTLNLSMLRYFFDNSIKENLFTGLNIWKCEDSVKAHLGRYPVIYLSFKDAKSKKWDVVLKHIKFEIANSYKEHRYLLNSEVLFTEEKIKFNEIISETASSFDFEVSLKLLSDFLNRYHKQKVVILIDEYDSPIQSGYDSYYDEVVPFMRNLLSGAFKDNSNLYKGFITGILRVSKESIFSGLNNLSVFSVLDNPFSDKFGFTEEEVKLLLKDFNVNTEYEQIKQWYNGYKFGRTKDIYNPWSILNYVLHPEDGFKTFWSNTSANEIIKNELVKKDAENLRKDVLSLIANESIRKDLEENFVFPEMEKKPELIWTLLIYSGYLTVKEQVSRKEYELIIPNYEIKTIFQDTVLYWFETDIKIYKSLLQSTAFYLISNNLPKFEEGFKKIMGDTFSYYDTAKTNEYIYQSYMLGLLAIVGDDYIIKSNRESGEGRYDIMLIPHDKSQFGVVIEIKQTEKQKTQESDSLFIERINKSINSAIEQIDKNKYYNELIDNKISSDKIIKVPIVFAGKEPYINIK